MKRNFIFTLLAVSVLTSTNRLAAQDRDVVAGIPVNYDESKVGNYKETLPDPLVMLDGTPVTTAKQWMKKRRPEIVKLFEEHQYGKWPAKKPKLRYTVKQDEGMDGMAVRKQVTIYFSSDDNGPR